jgi:hypothetical protein
VQQLAAQVPWFHNLKKPVGVAHWETRIVKSLPKELKDSLPTVEQIEKGLRDGE